MLIYTTNKRDLPKSPCFFKYKKPNIKLLRWGNTVILYCETWDAFEFLYLLITTRSKKSMERRGYVMIKAKYNSWLPSFISSQEDCLKTHLFLFHDCVLTTSRLIHVMWIALQVKKKKKIIHFNKMFSFPTSKKIQSGQIKFIIQI